MKREEWDDFHAEISATLKSRAAPSKAPPRRVALSGTGATDITPPETTAALDQPPNSAGWHTSDVTVTLSAADEPGGSGLKTLTYSSAGAQAAASTVVTGASVQIPVTAEGSTTISFFATDNAGNVEARKIVVVNIDKTSPQTSCGGSDGTWHGRRRHRLRRFRLRLGSGEPWRRPLLPVHLGAGGYSDGVGIHREPHGVRRGRPVYDCRSGGRPHGRQEGADHNRRQSDANSVCAEPRCRHLVRVHGWGFGHRHLRRAWRQRDQPGHGIPGSADLQRHGHRQRRQLRHHGHRVHGDLWSVRDVRRDQGLQPQQHGAGEATPV